jgi:hypothetical protein
MVESPFASPRYRHRNRDRNRVRKPCRMRKRFRCRYRPRAGGPWQLPTEGRVPPPGETRIRHVSPRSLQTPHPVILTSCPHPIPSPSPFTPISIVHPPGSDGIPADAEEHRPCRSYSASSVSRREPVPFPHQVFRLIPREDANGTGVFHAEPPRAPRLKSEILQLWEPGNSH